MTAFPCVDAEVRRAAVGDRGSTTVSVVDARQGVEVARAGHELAKVHHVDLGPGQCRIGIDDIRRSVPVDVRPADRGIRCRGKVRDDARE